MKASLSMGRFGITAQRYPASSGADLPDSRGATIVVLQESAQALTTNDTARVPSHRLIGIDDAIGQSLMVSLAVIVGDVILDSMPQHGFAEQDQSAQAFIFDGADKPLGIGVEVGAARRQADGLNAAFEGMNEFTGANDIKLVFEVVVLNGSDYVYEQFVLKRTDPHLKMIRDNQLQDGPANERDQYFNYNIDQMIQMINQTVNRSNEYWR